MSLQEQEYDSSNDFSATPYNHISHRRVFLLPAPATPLIGRTKELAQLQDLLQQDSLRLLTLIGPPGVGKTRLALAVANTARALFPHGVCFVPLASITDPALVLPTIAQTLGILVSDQPVHQAVHANLRNKHVLLVLDNMEQVLDAAQDLAALLVAAPHVCLIVTSRASLQYSSEQLFPLAPLPLPSRGSTDVAEVQASPAVELFVSRAQAIQPTFTLTNSNASTITSICQRLDGLPLALELAATRLRLLSPTALLKRLDQRLPLLTMGPRDVPIRHQTMRNALAWSYELLDEAEQQLFRRLGVFVGGFTLEAAVAVCYGEATMPEEGALNQLQALANYSLVHPMEVDKQLRFTLLETMREYALEQLVATGEMEQFCAAHLRYYHKLAEPVVAQIRGMHMSYYRELLELNIPTTPSEQFRQWLLLEREHDNLRAGLQWALSHGYALAALECSVTLGMFWVFFHHYNEGQQWIKRALDRVRVEAPDALHSPTAGWANFYAAVLALYATDILASRAYCEASNVVWNTLGDAMGLAYAQTGLGTVCRLQNDVEVAHTLFAESEVLFRKLDDPWGMAWMLICKAQLLAQTREDAAVERAMLEEALLFWRRADERWASAYTVQSMGLWFYRQGDYQVALPWLIEAAEIFKEAGDVWSAARFVYMLADAAWYAADIALAAAAYAEALVIQRNVGYRLGEALSLHGLGQVALTKDALGQATEHFAASLAIFQEMERSVEMSACLVGMAKVAIALQLLDWATQALSATAALLEAAGVAATPDTEWSGVDAIGAGLWSPAIWSAGVQRDCIQAVAVVQSRLPTATFAAAWAADRKSPINTLIVLMPQAIADRLNSAAAEPAHPNASTSSGLERNAESVVLHPHDTLSVRELEVLRLVAEGVTNHEIATRLTLSVNTVQTHVRAIFSKLGVSSRSAATRYALEHRII